MRRVLLGDSPNPLSPTEFSLLSGLALNSGQVMLPADLLRVVWGPAYVDGISLLRTAIWRLRRKLEADPSNPEYVLTVRAWATPSRATPPSSAHSPRSEVHALSRVRDRPVFFRASGDATVIGGQINCVSSSGPVLRKLR